MDLDLGLAIGAKLTEYDEFGYDEEFGCHTYQGSKGWHVVPFPVVQDVHLSFVFRFRSIGKKVQGGAERYDEWDNRQIEKFNERSRIRRRNWEIRDSMYKVRRGEAKAEKISRDSLRSARNLKDSLENAAKKKAKAEEKDKSRRKRKGKKIASKRARSQARLTLPSVSDLSKTEGEEQVSPATQARAGGGTSETPGGSAKADTPEAAAGNKKERRKEKRRKEKIAGKSAQSQARLSLPSVSDLSKAGKEGRV